MKGSGFGSSRQAARPVLVRDELSSERALTLFFLEHRRPLRRYLIAQGCAESDSDDIVQDAFLILRERWSTIAYYDRPKAYLYKIAIRLWYRHAARIHRGGYREDYESVLNAVPDPADTTLAVEVADALARWFRQLPRRQRNVAALRLIAELTEVETAEVLGVSLGTVKSQLNAARKTLRALRDRDERGERQESGRGEDDDHR
ncbi:sigma-70 family RNA polymerase sigma factor [Sphaerisporangium sp. NPDC005289]|uniref:RNA polymerase sigma factor n=1 Tax=Sphaerisporangium sp. NPDC005289 TaxID=3155247 RepID=UPI0033A382E7